MRLLITVVLASLACWFALGPQTAAVPLPERPVLAAGILDGTPMHLLKDDPTELFIGGQQLSCNDCHALFESRTATQGDLAQHTEIVLQHGMNDRCLNCHAHADRERLVLHDGTLVGLDEAPILCAKCHGPTWRDWTKGIHGRVSGYWDSTRGEPTKLGCTECHDPHSPAFPGLAPAPGPWTLRMGEPVHHEPDPENSTPLQRWKSVLDHVGEESSDG